MNAPINTFFDVTPVGKILVRFSKDLEIFKGGFFWCIIHLSNMIFAVCSATVLLGSVSPWNILSMLFVIYCFSLFAVPFTAIDNQLHKQASNVWTPIHSYWQEALRGSSVIRAFKKDDQFLQKEMEMMDKTTIQAVAHLSCWIWFNLRVQYTCKLIITCGLVSCLMLKGQVNNTMLAVLLS